MIYTKAVDLILRERARRRTALIGPGLRRRRPGLRRPPGRRLAPIAIAAAVVAALAFAFTR